MVLLNGKEASELSLGTTIRLERDTVVIGDGREHDFELLEHRSVALDLIPWCEGMHVAESIESDRCHHDRRVKLHRARSEWDHSVRESKVLVT